MNSKHVVLGLACVLSLSGCAAERAFNKGKDMLDHGKTEAGLHQVEEAARIAPKNKEYRIYLARQREASINALLGQAEQAYRTGQLDAADAAFRRVLALDVENRRAQAGLDGVEMDRKHRVLLADAQTLLVQGNSAAATEKLNAVLAENPRSADARALKARLEAQKAKKQSESPALQSVFKKPITLEFRNADLKAIFEVISRSAGINFIFDKDVRQDLVASIFVKNTRIESAIDFLLMTNQLAKKVLNENTLLVYPNIPAKTRDYQDLRARTFYLANMGAKQALNIVKTIVKTRDVVIDEKLNTLVMRDTPEAILLAEKVLGTQDLAESEVLLEVEVLEVSRSRLTDIGINPPTEATFRTLGAGGAPSTTLADLKNLNSGLIGVSSLSASVRAKMDNGDTNLLANPRIRVKNREKAKVHIGERVPIITTTVTSAGTTSFLPETVNYLDVGIKFEVEPLISLNNEVTIKVSLEVSSLGQKSVTKSGSEVYRVGTRNASTTLALRDGETQALAGLISDEERKTVSGIPGFGQIPAVGRLFASKSNSTEKTEIVLLITPHIVRNLDRTALADADFAAGTDSSAGSAPMSLQSIAQEASNGVADPAADANAPGVENGSEASSGQADPAAAAEAGGIDGTAPAPVPAPVGGTPIEARDPQGDAQEASPDAAPGAVGDDAATAQEGQ